MLEIYLVDDLHCFNVKYNLVWVAWNFFILTSFSRLLKNTCYLPLVSSASGTQYPKVDLGGRTCFLKSASPFNSLLSFLVYANLLSIPANNFKQKMYYIIIIIIIREVYAWSQGKFGGIIHSRSHAGNWIIAHKLQLSGN